MLFLFIFNTPAKKPVVLNDYTRIQYSHIDVNSEWNKKKIIFIVVYIQRL